VNRDVTWVDRRAPSDLPGAPPRAELVRVLEVGGLGRVMGAFTMGRYPQVPYPPSIPHAISLSDRRVARIAGVRMSVLDGEVVISTVIFDLVPGRSAGSATGSRHGAAL
jgi:hypothetical protein